MTQLEMHETPWCVYTPRQSVTPPRNHAIDWIDDDGKMLTRCGQVFAAGRAGLGRSLRKDCKHCLRLLRGDLEEANG